MSRDDLKSSSLSQKLRAMMNEKGLRIADVAKQTNLTPNSVRYMVCGITKNPAPDKLRKIAELFNVTIESLINSEAAILEENKSSSKKPFLEKGFEKQMPIINWNKIKHWCSLPQARSQVKITNFIQTEKNFSPNAFALEAKHETRGVIPPGSILLIDPEISIKANHYVIASINKQKPTIKIVCESPQGFFLNGVGYNVLSEKLLPPNIVLGTIFEVRQNFIRN